MNKVFFSMFLSLMILLISCSSSSSPTSGNPTLVETEQLKLIANSVEDALVKGDAKTLKSLFLTKYLVNYTKQIDAAPTKLAGFAELFKTRRLIALSQIYAVYEVEYNGAKYEICFGVDDDGAWKLMNF